MIVFDSSCWLEVFCVGQHSRRCESELKKAKSNVLVPTIVLYEVYKKIMSKIGESKALSAIALMDQFKVEELTKEIALHAADIATETGLPMADSFVLAHARSHKATLVTLDNDFAKFKDARVLRR